MYKLRHKNNQALPKGKLKGFGLMEVLISAVIIIIILSALVTIGRAAMSNNENLAERTQAIYLAQEGIETVRQIRDSNWIDGSNLTKWNTLEGDTTVSSGDYVLSYITNKWILSNMDSYETISLGPTGKAVSFYRTINITAADDAIMPTPGNNPNLSLQAIKATATVTWEFSGQTKRIEVSEILTNWRPDF